MKDEQITEYIDEYYFESEITHLESRILYLLKIRQEMYPSENNDLQWKNFSEWVITRKKPKVNTISR